MDDNHKIEAINMDIAQQYLEAWNTHSPQQILECFLPDGIYIDANLDDEIPAALFAKRAEELFHCFPNLQIKITQRTQDDAGFIVSNWELSGALDNQVLRGLDMLYVRDNKIQSIQVYFDYRTGQIFAKVPSLHLSFHPQTKPVKSNTSSETADLNPPNTAPVKYRTSGLSNQEIKQVKEQLEVLMTEQQLYLENDLALSGLAERLELSSNHLSQVINSQFHCCFYDFVNHYRIRHATQLIETESRPSKSLTLALDSGFRSTSTFYSAFKKETGTSPSQYRVQTRKQSNS